MKETENQATTNSETNSQADKLTDLQVTDEQADRATGGFDLSRVLIGTDGGVWR